MGYLYFTSELCTYSDCVRSVVERGSVAGKQTAGGGAICREARWAGERFDRHARAVLEQYSWSSVVVSY